MRPLLLLSFAALTAQAQTIKGAVLTRNEPHHHLAYEDDVIRVLRVGVSVHDTTWLHEHDVDYFWIIVGASTIINAKLGAPDATLKLPDLSMHYTPGHFAHVARNIGKTAFDNVTVELLHPQTGARNLCAAAVEDKALDCKLPRTAPGVVDRPELTTDQLRVSLVTLQPGKARLLDVTTKPTWIVALDSADVARGLVVPGAGEWKGGTIRLTQPGTQTLKNNSARQVRALVIIAR